MKVSKQQNPIWVVDGMELKPPTRIFRVEFGNHRYYYTYGKGKFKFYVSATTICKFIIPESKYLTEWKMNTPNYEEVASVAAHYGNVMHHQQQDYVMKQRWSKEKAIRWTKKYIEREKLDPDLIHEWTDRLIQDMLGFAQFCSDIDFHPVAVEYPMVDNRYSAGGRIDLIGDMTIEETGYFGETYTSGVKAGMPKKTKKKFRVRALIDQKSGRKAFYENYPIQLAIYKRMWDGAFKDIYPLERVFNYGAKDWQSEPGYRLKDQTGQISDTLLKHILRMVELFGYDKPTARSIKLDQDEIGWKTHNHFSIETLEEKLKEAHAVENK